MPAHDHCGLCLTRLRITRLPGHDGLVGLADATLNQSVRVSPIKLIQDRSGKRFAAFPERIRPDGRTEQCVHPVSHGARAWLEGALFDALDRLAAPEDVPPAAHAAVDFDDFDDAAERAYRRDPAEFL